MFTKELGCIALGGHALKTMPQWDKVSICIILYAAKASLPSPKGCKTLAVRG